MSRASSIDHIFHVWINQRQSELRKDDPKHEHEHSLYEFKSMLQFLEYGHRILQKAFEGSLATKHQQCSHQLPVPILNNTLRCALGVNVTECPILRSLRDSFAESTARIMPFNGKPAYSDVEPEAVYEIMAKTCAWHMYKESTGATEQFHIDTSEGWLMDESDRMFWNNVYDSLRAGDEVPEDSTK